MAIAVASDPASGSVVASAPSSGSGPHSGGTQRCFWASVPSSRTVPAKKPAEQMRLPIAASPQVSSSAMRQAVMRSSMPPPPYSSGMSKHVRPISAAFRKTSRGNSSVAS